LTILNIHIGVDGIFQKFEDQLRDFKNCGVSTVKLLPRRWFVDNLRSSINSGKITDCNAAIKSRLGSAKEAALFIPSFLDSGTALNLAPKETLPEKLLVLGESLSEIEIKYHLFLPNHSAYLYDQILRGRSKKLDVTLQADWGPLIEILTDGVGSNAKLVIWDATNQAEAVENFLIEVCAVDADEARRVSRTHTIEFSRQVSTEEIQETVLENGWSV